MPSQYRPTTPRRRSENSETTLVCEHCGAQYIKTTKYGNRPSRFCSRRGYGKISRDGSMDYAHRVSYEIHIGPIPSRMDVRHYICDNPPCVRPDHLRIGPRRLNMQDAMTKGRTRRGLANWNARLTDAQVLEIRARFGAGGILQAELAAQYGISERYVSQIVCFQRRRHAGDEEQPPAPTQSA
jgi:hypothetical protein